MNIERVKSSNLKSKSLLKKQFDTKLSPKIYDK